MEIVVSEVFQTSDERKRNEMIEKAILSVLRRERRRGESAALIFALIQDRISI